MLRLVDMGYADGKYGDTDTTGRYDDSGEDSLAKHVHGSLRYNESRYQTGSQG